MASTYSTNLKIDLMGTGEQDGTWGTVTNTNLGTLIEQAISGYVTQAITDGADTVITIPDGASGVARNMFLELTNTLTATRNLIVPANKKLYFIYNNTTGGFAVTVKVSGLTGVSVPNGRKVILVCNGTDIVEAHNAISGNATVGGTLVVTGATTAASFSGAGTGLTGTAASLTAGNVTTNANLTGMVTSVGNAASLGSFTSAQLAAAVTGETGNGALVFATSPTLVTPALGTPSSGTLTNCDGTAASLTAGNATTAAACSGNAATATTSAALTNGGTLNTPGSGTLTNCTGLPIVAGTTGTLSVARGGTGVTGSTGSGSVVLSNSPSLTSPALGTPSSGNLSSCTFPTLNQNTTGSSGTSSALTNNSPLNTPSSGNLSNCTNLPIVAGTTGTLSVARGGTGATNSVGTGNYVMLNSSPTVDGTGIGYPDSAAAGGFGDNQIAFGYLGTDVYVSVDNAASGSFVTLSDYRIKKDVRTLSSNATYITNAIRVVDYEVLELDGTQAPERAGIRRAGVIAHEIQALIPNAASGTKDAVNANGSPHYQSVNYDAVIPFLIKTIQELTARIEKLEG